MSWPPRSLCRGLVFGSSCTREKEIFEVIRGLVRLETGGAERGSDARINPAAAVIESSGELAVEARDGCKAGGELLAQAIDALPDREPM